MVVALAFVALSWLAPQEAAIVERHHPVARLVATQPDLRESGVELAPSRRFNPQVEESHQKPDDTAPFDGDALEELVRRCVAPGRWHEHDWTVDLVDHELVVRVPEAVQAEVAAFLAKLTQAVACTALLEVCVLAPAPDGLAAGLRPVAEADRLLAAAQEKGTKRVRELRLALRDALVQRARGGESRTQVVDFEVEIAHAMSVQDPITHEARLGLELAARSARVDGGTLLDLALREVEAAGEETRRLAARHLLLLAEESLDPPGAGTIVSLRTAFVSLTGTFLLPDGAALLLPCQVDTVDGPASFLIDLRVVGDARPAFATIDLPPAIAGAPERCLLFGQLGGRGLGGTWTAPPRSWLYDALADSDDGDHGIASFLGAWPLDDEDEELEAVRRAAAIDAEERHEVGPLARGGVLALLERESAGRFAQSLAERSSVPPPLLVTGEIVDRDGRQLARFGASLLLDRALTLWSGRGRQRLPDWDVDVACLVNGVNPEMEPAVDGFALRLEATRATAGGIELRVDGKLRFALRPPVNRELHGAESLEIDHELVRTLALEEARLVGAGGGTLELGSDELTLKLTIAAPPVEPASKSQVAAGAAIVEERLPVGALLRLRTGSGGDIALFPIRIGGVTAPAAGDAGLLDERDDRGPLFLDDDLIEFARAAVDEATWRDAANEVRIDGSELVVRAPADVARRVVERVTWLARRRAPSRELIVRLLGADGTTPLRTLRTALHDRVPQRATAGRRETFVRDWEVEICERSAVADPIVAELFSGLELVARAEAVAGGTLLALALSGSEPAAPTVVVEPEAVARLRTDARLFTPRACGAIDEPRQAFLSLAGDLFVPDGATVRLPCRVESIAGPCAFTLELELAGEKPPPSDRPGQRLLDAHSGLPIDPPDELFDDGWSHELEGRETEALIARLPRDRREGDVPDRLAEALAGALAIDAKLVDADGRVRAAFAVTALGGRRSSFATGVEGTRIADWDVDVANDAATVNPDVEAWVDGLALSLAPTRDGAGRALRVVLAACLLDELPRGRDLDDASHLRVEELRAKRLHLDQFVALPDAGGTLTLGGGGLTLELRCTPLATR